MPAMSGRLRKNGEPNLRTEFAVKALCRQARLGQSGGSTPDLRRPPDLQPCLQSPVCPPHNPCQPGDASWTLHLPGFPPTLLQLYPPPPFACTALSKHGVGVGAPF